jgi:hypothetical protein
MIFLRHFLIPFSIWSLFSVAYWVCGRTTNPLLGHYLKPKFYPELSSFPNDQQVLLIRDAAMEANESWKTMLSGLFMSFCFALALALERGFEGRNGAPMLYEFVSLLLSLYVAQWLAVRMQVRYMKPFLRSAIEEATKCKLYPQSASD